MSDVEMGNADLENVINAAVDVDNPNIEANNESNQRQILLFDD